MESHCTFDLYLPGSQSSCLFSLLIVLHYAEIFNFIGKLLKHFLLRSLPAVPVITDLRRLMQEVYKFKAYMGY